MNPESPRPAAASPRVAHPGQRRAIAADHPSLAGHFPGNPIVPGLVILEEVVQALESWRPGSRTVGMPVVKFLAPLRPEQAFTIHFAESGTHGIRFECIRDDGQPLVQGFLTVVRVEDSAPTGSTSASLRPK